VECQFDDGPPVAVGLELTPVPTPLPMPDWTSVASSDVLPGVQMDLRIPSTSVIAGMLLLPEFVVNNTSDQDLWVAAGVEVELPGQAPSQRWPPDPREFPAWVPSGPAGAFNTRLPAGQEVTLSRMAQLPFDIPDQPVRLHAYASLGTPSGGMNIGPVLSDLQADVPLQLNPPSDADQLQLELHADRQQWCLKATDANGQPPSGPLFARLSEFSSGGPGERDFGLPGGSGGLWAQRWDELDRMVNPPRFQDGVPATLDIWVAGPQYVTAHVQMTL
jgi:hypothetical protein